MSQPKEKKQLKTAPFWRRIAALIYDGLIVIAISLITWSLLLTTHIVLFGSPESGERIQLHGFEKFLYLIVLIITNLFYFCWFWLKAGQTTGARTWRIQVITEDGLPLSTNKVMLRAGIMLISLCFCFFGYLWILLDKKNRSWHDLTAQTQVIVLPKPNK